MSKWPKVSVWKLFLMSISAYDIQRTCDTMITKCLTADKSLLPWKVMTTFPTNVPCSSSATVGSSDHVLGKFSISLAIVREQPQHWQVWQFTQATWLGLQAAIILQNWSPISTASDINSAWEFFHRNLLSLMHRLIPSHLIFSYLTHPPTLGTPNPVVRQVPYNNLHSLPGRQI